MGRRPVCWFTWSQQRGLGQAKASSCFWDSHVMQQDRCLGHEQGASTETEQWGLELVPTWDVDIAVAGWWLNHRIHPVRCFNSLYGSGAAAFQLLWIKYSCWLLHWWTFCCLHVAKSFALFILLWRSSGKCVPSPQRLVSSSFRILTRN